MLNLSIFHYAKFRHLVVPCLLSKLAKATGEASEAKSRATEHQLAVTRLEADRAVAV